mgnify:CR=1 FL=1
MNTSFSLPNPTQTQAANLPIQSATWRDLKNLSRLEKQCFRKGDSWPLFELFSLLISPTKVKLKIDYNHEMIAFLAGEHDYQKNLGWITTLCVAPTWRRMGLGFHLTAAGETALGTATIRLTARMTNQEAIHLYQKAGYKPIGVEKRYYEGGEDGLVMEKKRST